MDEDAADVLPPAEALLSDQVVWNVIPAEISQREGERHRPVMIQSIGNSHQGSAQHAPGYHCQEGRHCRRCCLEHYCDLTASEDATSFTP